MMFVFCVCVRVREREMEKRSRERGEVCVEQLSGESRERVESRGEKRGDEPVKG